MNILFIDTVHPLLKSSLEGAGQHCEDGTQWTREEVLSRVSAYEGVVIRSRIKLDKEFLDQATQLRFIARVGAGMENIDVTYAGTKGIQCFHAPEGNRDAVGEQAIAMLLSLFENLNRADREVRAGIWRREQNRGVELQGKTVGIIGYGNTGGAFAKKLSGFDCTVIAFDKYRRDFSDRFAKEVTMEELFSDADVLSLHVPLNPETHYLINDDFLASFRKEIYVVNTSRGLCLHTEALVKHMKSGKVKGACLDVVEYEDTSFENFDFVQNESWKYLVESDRTVLSPHIAGWTQESNEKMAKVLFEKISRLVQ
jgi:D-3-phosphoglycerate dehydrogenase / 2-oxoglutarate reductase